MVELAFLAGLPCTGLGSRELLLGGWRGMAWVPGNVWESMVHPVNLSQLEALKDHKKDKKKKKEPYTRLTAFST
jgi:hypothetical protein